jgi:hypothetical protein
MYNASLDEQEVLEIIEQIPKPLNEDIMSTYDKI